MHTEESLLEMARLKAKGAGSKQIEEPSGGLSFVIISLLLLLFFGISLLPDFFKSSWAEWWHNFLSLNSILSRSVATVVVILIGVGLFLFRKWDKTYYGMAELAFAMFMSIKSVLDIASDQFQHPLAAAGIFSSAYLIVRGLDNMGAKKEEKRKEAALKEQLLSECRKEFVSVPNQVHGVS